MTLTLTLTLTGYVVREVKDKVSVRVIVIVTVFLVSLADTGFCWWAEFSSFLNWMISNYFVYLSPNCRHKTEYQTI